MSPINIVLDCVWVLLSMLSAEPQLKANLYKRWLEISTVPILRKPAIHVCKCNPPAEPENDNTKCSLRHSFFSTMDWIHPLPKPTVCTEHVTKRQLQVWEGKPGCEDQRIRTGKKRCHDKGRRRWERGTKGERKQEVHWMKNKQGGRGDERRGRRAKEAYHTEKSARVSHKMRLGRKHKEDE